MTDFRRLRVWRKAHASALNAHRAAMSIPTNIVEGREQKSEREFGQFLQYAISSTLELEYHLIAARDMDTIGQNDFLSLLSDLIEMRKMLHGLLDRLRVDKARHGL